MQLTDAQESVRKFYLKLASDSIGTPVDLTCPITSALFIGSRIARHNLNWFESVKLGINGYMKFDYDIKPDIVTIKD